MSQLPRNPDDDTTPDIIRARQDFITEQTGATLEHIRAGSLDPASTAGNIERLAGVAQVPLAFAGPMQVNGEHASGDFYVPMATTEGTLIASYTRGMRVTREAGGATVAVVDDVMQRAPVFGFENAAAAARFGDWVQDHLDDIREVAQATSSVAKLRNIEHYAAARFLYLRFNYTTGDAAGQNMVGKATWAACQWIVKAYDGAAPIAEYSLSGNIDTDKKSSQMNQLHSRGKRVIAECVIPAQLMRERLRVEPERLFAQRQRSTLGAQMAGSMNNGAHAANALAAIFIATGQDAGNVAESHAGLGYSELRDNGDYYMSITLPSVIVASYGGGTGLATQRECLEVMGCYGQGKARKLAEIVGAAVLCGELSLGAAVVAGDWVSSHDKLGRNRP